MIKLQFYSLVILLIISFTTNCKIETSLEKTQSETKQEMISDDSADKEAAKQIVYEFIDLSIKKEREKALQLRAKTPSPTENQSLNSNTVLQNAATPPSIEGAYVFLSIFPLSDYKRHFEIEEFSKDFKATILVSFLSPTNDEKLTIRMRFILKKEDKLWKIEEGWKDNSPASPKDEIKL